MSGNKKEGNIYFTLKQVSFHTPSSIFLDPIIAPEEKSRDCTCWHGYRFGFIRYLANSALKRFVFTNPAWYVAIDCYASIPLFLLFCFGYCFGKIALFTFAAINGFLAYFFPYLRAWIG
jgi:hypothetical protein